MKTKKNQKLKAFHKNMIKGMLLLIMLITLTLISCDSEVDTDLNGVIDPCENEHFFGLNIYDPWSGSTPLSKNVDLGTSDEIAASLGGSVTYSNASTYNYDLEIYHFFNTANKKIINIDGTPPATFVTLIGEVTSIYSHLVYVSSLAKNYIIEKESGGTVNLVEVDVNTGVLGATIATDFSEEINSISVTTNNINEVYIIINKTLIKLMNLDSVPTVSLFSLEAPSTNYLFFGAEYNSLSGGINVIRTQGVETIHLVKIDLGGDYTLMHDLTTVIENEISLTNHFYSTTLNCEETQYRIAYLYGNNNTRFHEITLSTGLVETDTKEADYYFGIESNANN
ncbi:hypothetical protein CXF68_08245 [Tenacibaculum sp. Bg11-29]|uniref:hypothetical protein n=1 Tax=Tenacibaculum sp. Bg11-29 TaxID=2058306 RepID=UPI000C346223|nr:hypothetical protein [Tenacibaculum sp. Bg11-29]PKH50687.1 hypothetical protein CXF68_08245 [Tenacibaculum sp. Bg11-29]